MMKIFVDDRKLIFYTVISVIFIPCLILALLGFRVNLTPSMPLGIWQQIGDIRSLPKSIPVTFCLPNTNTKVNRMIIERQYLPKGKCENGFAPLLKYVAAVPGDVVDIDMDAVSVNGRVIPNSATMLKDREGHPMIFIPRGRYIVNKNEYWFMAVDRKNSLDSRYFGAIPAAFILHAMKPVATFSLYPNLTRQLF